MTIKQKQEYNKRLFKWGLLTWGVVMIFIFLFYFFSNSNIEEINTWGEIVGHFTGSFFKCILYLFAATISFCAAWVVRGWEKESIGLKIDNADITELRQWNILISAAIREKCLKDNKPLFPWEVTIKDYFLMDKTKDEEKPQY